MPSGAKREEEFRRRLANGSNSSPRIEINCSLAPAILLLAVCAFSGPAWAQTTPCPGDLDGDEKRTVRDAVRLIGHISGQSNLQGASFTAADVNADGAVDVADVVRLSRHLSAIEALSPCIPPSAPPVIDGFSPSSASIGTPVTIVGRNFAPASGGSPQVAINRLGGGTIAAPVASHSNENIVFVVPTSAASGPLSVSVAGRSATSADSLEIVPSSDFQLFAAPSFLRLIQGESAVFSISLASSNGFSQLAALTVSELPQGVTASFSPPQIGAGQFSLLTLSASPQQPPSQAAFAVTASATVDGLEVMQSVQLSLDIEPVTTSFMGRTVVADTLQTPLSGVTITLLGRDGDGTSTGCSGQTASDAAGNFAFTNLPAECLGAQLIRYDGLTATIPPGEYAGVDLVTTIVADQVNESPVLIHLPRIDDAETVLVQQNASVDQTFTFQTIPNLTVLVYAGTVFTLLDGSQPDPFPLTAVQVPVDRLPDEVPPSTEFVEPFIVAFQPANATASQPVAVSFPNLLNDAPSTQMPLLTLDPTRGTMVVYGTGTVSANGSQIVPDFNPETPGKRYGLVHFDWHGPRRPQPAPGPNVDDPSPEGCVEVGDPIDLSSGLQVIRETDLRINGLRGSIQVTRVYRTRSTSPGPFGIGSNHNYGYRLDTDNPQAAEIINLIVPDGNRFPFVRGGAGTLANTTIPSLLGAELSNTLNGGMNLRWKDGTVFHFVPSIRQLGSILESITDSNGNRITLVRSPESPAQITEIIDPVGRKLLLSYDATNRITSIVDPIGRTVQYTYNALGTLETATDAAGGVTRYDYAAADRLRQITDARGVVVARNSYDADGRVIEQVQADGGILKFEFTLLNPGVPTSSVIATRFTDARGNVTIYRFNPQGFLTDVVDAMGQTRIFERAPGTNLLLAIRGNGVCGVCGSGTVEEIRFSYDANGNITSQTDALGNTTTFTYDPKFNQVTSVTDPLRNVSRFSYDAVGNLVTATDANGNSTIIEYDSFGLITAIVDPLDSRLEIGYDGFGNATSITDPLGNLSSIRYDAVSRAVELVDSLSQRTALTYDSLDRLLSLTDALRQTTTASFDAIGNLLSVTDARGNPTSFTYDSMGRRETRTDSLGRQDERQYDGNSNVIQFTDRRGQTSRFAYDSLDRLTRETYQDGSVVKRSYDLRSRLMQAEDSESGTFSFTYDEAGRRLSSVGPFGTVNYSRDLLSRVSTRQVAGQSLVDYDYDPASNLLAASGPEVSVSFVYDQRNQLVQKVQSNGIVTDYSYDELGRILTLIHSGPGGILDSQSYAYDAVGNRTHVVSDLAQPLITRPSVNQYNSASNQLVRRGSVTYTHDENGSRLTEANDSGSTTFFWDSRNRLAQIQFANGDTSSFQYDFAGNLIAQTTMESSGGTSTNFLLDDLTNVVRRSNSTGQSIDILTGRSIDDYLTVFDSEGQAESRLTDALNSTMAVTNSNGEVRRQYSYDPFGESDSDDGKYLFRYTGRILVAENLYYHRTRFYDSRTKRFLNEDPIGFLGQDVNLYRYVFNSPATGFDPLGLRSYRSLSDSKLISDLEAFALDVQRVGNELDGVQEFGFDMKHFLAAHYTGLVIRRRLEKLKIPGPAAGLCAVVATNVLGAINEIRQAVEVSRDILRGRRRFNPDDVFSTIQDFYSNLGGSLTGSFFR